MEQQHCFFGEEVGPGLQDPAPQMGTNLSQKALITEYQCHWIWAGRDDCFQIYNLQVCTLCAIGVQLSTNIAWNPFESVLHIHSHLLG